MVYDTRVDFSDSASNQRIDDVTFADPISFRLLIDAQRYPNTEFTVQTASIPEISVDAAPYATPQRTIEIAGDKISYSPFSCSFIIDEKLENYHEIHEWLLGLVIEQDSRSIKKTRDVSLIVLDSNNNPTREIKFVDAYPVSLTTLDFDVKNTTVDYLTAEVTFNYSYFKIQ